MKPSIKRAIKLLKANAVFVAENTNVAKLMLPETTKLNYENCTIIILKGE
jgi:hypothetical protein